ncbi:MAG: ABC transporter substrate-binding protein [Rhodospirillaceae bacterium]|nr:ABC transporter substrate-binding protein [Rhodospirillaceae bacterium]
MKAGRGSGRLQAAALALALLLAAAPAAAEAPPQRIVSLNVCVDQLLLLTVAPARIAALTQHATDPDFTNMPAEAKGFRQTHGRAEEVVPLRPDLVIGGEYTTPETIDLLRRLGIRVAVMKLANSLADVRSNMRWLGDLVGERAKAETMVAALDRRLAAVAARIPPGPRPVIAFYDTSGYTAAPGTLAGDVIRAAGFDNLAARLGIGFGGRLSLEALATQPIDALLVVDTKGAAGARAMEIVHHPVVEKRAARLPHAAIPGRLWICETPHIADAVERIAALRGRIARKP